MNSITTANIFEPKPSRVLKKQKRPVVRTPPHANINLEHEQTGLISNQIHTVSDQLLKKQRIHSLRILALLICQIRPGKDSHFTTYQIHKNTLWRAIGADPFPSHDDVETVMKDMLGSVFTTRQQNGDFIGFPYMSAAKLQHDGVCLLRLNSLVKPFLLLDAPFNYRRLHLHSIYKLRSVYSILLYMFLRRFIGRKKEQQHNVSYDDLLTALQINGTYYRKRHAEFETDVLRTSIKEINEKTELKASYKIERDTEAPLRGPVHMIQFVLNECSDKSHKLSNYRAPKINSIFFTHNKYNDVYDPLDGID